MFIVVVDERFDQAVDVATMCTLFPPHSICIADDYADQLLFVVDLFMIVDYPCRQTLFNSPLKAKI